MPKADMPLLSLVVPTRNRQAYAMSLLRGIQAYKTDEVEVIVQDNSDDASLGDGVRALDDARIRYVHLTDRLNMHQNFDLAIDQTRGEFVLGIGDDDGLLVPAALSGLKEAKVRGADAVLSEIHVFTWPGIAHRIWGDMREVDTTHEYRGLGGQLVDARDAADDLFRRGSIGGLGRLPRVYQGYVATRCLRALKARCGTYFPGGSPDLANAIALVPFVRSIYVDPRVSIITGHSPRSGGGQGAAGQHHSELEAAKHLPAETVRNWDPRIPRFWSGTTIYAQTAVEAARAVDLVPRYPFNFQRVSAACLIFQPNLYRHHVTTALGAQNSSFAKIWPSMALEYAKVAWRRTGYLVRNIALHRLGLGSIGRFSSIEEMMDALGRPSYDEPLSPHGGSGPRPSPSAR